MFQKIRGWFSGNSLRREIDRLNGEIGARNNASKALFEEAHFRDKTGRMLPKGEVPKHLRGLASVAFD